MNELGQSDVEERLRLQIEAYHGAALVYAAVKLGLPDRMGALHWTAEELAGDLGLSGPHLFRFLRGLVTLGLCAELQDQTFALTETGHSLASGSPSRLAEKVRIVVEQYWQPWAHLVSCLETGTPAFELVFGMTVGDWRRKHAEQGEVFNSYLAKETHAQAGPIVEALDFSAIRTVADIGGGYGGLLAAVLTAHPHVAGILFDLPHTVEGAKPFLQAQGVAERVERVGGDFLAAIPVRADLYLLKGVLQQWDDTKTLTILRQCRKAMPDGARLCIIERLVPERATDDPSAVMLDLHMMAITGGRARRLDGLTALLVDAGLALTNVLPTRSGLTIIEAAAGG